MTLKQSTRRYTAFWGLQYPVPLITCRQLCHLYMAMSPASMVEVYIMIVAIV